MCRKENGFTLIETLLVLAAFLIISAIGFTVPLHILQQQEINHFLNEFQQDILYLQEINMYEESPAYLTIDPPNRRYTIRKSGTGMVILQRKIPVNIRIQLRTLKQPITYMNNGTIKNPGTLTIETDSGGYNIVFPFGKGRSYIEKQ